MAKKERKKERKGQYRQMKWQLFDSAFDHNDKNR